jgi:hypothetical protein
MILRIEVFISAITTITMLSSALCGEEPDESKIERVYEAVTNQFHANARSDSAKAEQVQMQTKASIELSELLRNSFIVGSDGSVFVKPENLARIAAAAAKANPTGDISELIGSLMAATPNPSEDSLRQAAAIRGQLPNTSTAFTTDHVQKLQDNELARSIAIQRAKNEASLHDAIVVPQGSCVFVHPSDTRFSQVPVKQEVIPPSASPLQNHIPTPAQVPVSPYRDPKTGAIVVP